MRPQTFYGMCLLSVALWCSLPATSWARRPTVYGGIALPGVALHVGVGVPGPYYPSYRYRHYRPYAVVAPVLYPPVLYAAPPVVYAVPPVVYSTPVVVQPVPPPAAATLQILVAPLQVDIYLNGRYVGRAEEFRDGDVLLNVSPGRHTVELRFGTITHTHTVTVGAGAVTVINDRLS